MRKPVVVDFAGMPVPAEQLAFPLRCYRDRDRDVVPILLPARKRHNAGQYPVRILGLP